MEQCTLYYLYLPENCFNSKGEPLTNETLGDVFKKIDGGAEYNYMMNASYKEGADQSGYSAFASVNLSKDISLYARFDDLISKNNWNIAKDESDAILGAQFKLGKYVKIAPNFRMVMPKAEGAKNSYSAYINCYFGFELNNHCYFVLWL